MAADGIRQLLRYSDLNKSRFLNPKNTIFPNMLIIDCSADLISPMIRLWSFQGLVDETVGIKFETVKLAKSLISNEKPPSEESDKNALLGTRQPYFISNSSDKLFERIKDIH
jgi:hypothetical protein